MKKLLIALLVVTSAMTLIVSDAQARRLGGGGSFGRQSQNAGRMPQPSPFGSPNQASRPGSPAAAPMAPPMTPPIKPPSPWKGILGGALLGLGMGALFSHFGMGGAMGGMFGSILMIALLGMAAMFIFRMFRGKSSENQPQPAYSGGFNADSGRTPEIGSRIEQPYMPNNQPLGFQGGNGAAANTTWGIPADFDTQGFLRSAKTYFIRLQAAWDKADSNDIREFTSPEMYAEVKMQLQERGASPNNTDVVTLDAELLGIETVGTDYLASVKFSGTMKEAVNAPAEPFAEVWNMSKPTSGQSGWVLAGIQQLN